jgi:hypothetical protein
MQRHLMEPDLAGLRRGQMTAGLTEVWPKGQERKSCSKGQYIGDHCLSAGWPALPPR